jgi:hypothetical protein
MTIEPVAPSERSLVRAVTPYLEVETQPISSLERMIVPELAHGSHAMKRKKRKDGDQSSSIRTGLVGDALRGPLSRRKVRVHAAP